MTQLDPANSVFRYHKTPPLGAIFLAVLLLAGALGAMPTAGILVTNDSPIATRGVPGSRALIRRDFDTLAPNDGFLGGFRTTETLRPGTVIDRFGGRRGTFASPAGTPFSRRGLPPEAASRRLDTLEVRRPLDVDAGIAAPAFGGGGGVQFKLPSTVQELIDAGVLVPK